MLTNGPGPKPHMHKMNNPHMHKLNNQLSASVQLILAVFMLDYAARIRIRVSVSEGYGYADTAIF